MIVSDQFIILIVGMVFLLSLPLLVFLTKTVQNITSYLYMNARLKAKEGRLITRTQFDDMVSAHSLAEISSLLESTPYGSDMQGGMVSNAESLEEVLQKHQRVLSGEIAGMMPAKIRDAFSYLYREMEAVTVKRILREVHGQLPSGQVARPVASTEQLNEETLKRMAEARSIAELLPFLEGTPYESLAVNLPAYEQTKRLNILEAALDRIVMSETWRIISSHKDLALVRDYFASRIDVMNLKVLLRAKRDRLRWDEIECFLLPQGTLYNRAMAGYAEEEDIPGFVNSLETMPFYSALMEVLPDFEKTSSLVQLEKALDLYMVRAGWDVSIKNPYGLGPLVGFLSLKEAEMRNVRIVAVGKEARLGQDAIRSLMVSL